MSGDSPSVQEDTVTEEGQGDAPAPPVEEASEPSPVEISTEHEPDAPAEPGDKNADPAQVWAGAGQTLQEKLDAAEAERRNNPRKGVRLNKLISAYLEGSENATALYLHLVDISEGGMRVNGDIEFSLDTPFTLRLQSEAFGPEIAAEFSELLVTCKVVWQKRLLGGMFVSGLQFQNMSPETQHCVNRILELCSPEGRRLRFRLNRVLGVGIGLDEQTRWLYPLALDLSVEGMRVRLDEPLNVGEKFPLQIFLEFDLPTVHMTAEVVWKEEVGPSRYQVGFRFSELTEENARAIQEYIDRCLAKESL